MNRLAVLAGAFVLALTLRSGVSPLPEAPAPSEQLRDALNDGPFDPDTSGLIDTKSQRAIAQRPAQAPAAAPASAAPQARSCWSDPPPVQAPNASSRVTGRSFPSTFQAWEPSSDGGGRPDLVWKTPEGFGLRGQCPEDPADTDPKTGLCKYQGLATAFDASHAKLDRGPDTVLLAEIRWHDASPNYLPSGEPFWQRGADGPDGTMRQANSTLTYPMYFMNYADPCLQKAVVLKCQAAIRAGLDGCFFDWWHPEDRSLNGSAMTALLRRVRAAVGDAVILVNANGSTPPDLGDANGVYMEGFGAQFWGHGGQGGLNGTADVPPFPPAEHWNYLISHLKAVDAAESRDPKINAVEGWGDAPGGPKYDPRGLRALTAVVLIYSNDYALFSRPNKYVPNHDHAHAWDAFWTPDLGRPLDSKPVDPPRTVPGTGLVYREFSNGVAVYNPLPATGAGSPADVPESFLRERRLTRSHKLGGAVPTGPLAIAAGDADILTR